MKKKKSLHGFLTDKTNPISIEEIVQELKRDRSESDARREAVFDKIVKNSIARKNFPRVSADI